MCENDYFDLATRMNVAVVPKRKYVYKRKVLASHSVRQEYLQFAERPSSCKFSTDILAMITACRRPTGAALSTKLENEYLVLQIFPVP